MDDLFTLDIHEVFMSRAIELAKQGHRNVSPNPMAGCVLIHNGEVIGEGYHEQFGGPHAEVMAIRNARQAPVDATAYINLEPCCFMGKTPPCTDALIQNGISEVFVGMLDPNPEVYGKGIDALEKAGISVHVGILQDECENLNRPFKKWVTTGLPWVIAKVAQSVDGYMGMDSETSIWLTGETARTHSHTLRASVDAILIGRQTALIDNPNLTVRQVRGANPKRVILDTNRTLSLSLDIFQDKQAETMILCSENRFKRTQTHLCQYIPVKEENNRLSPIHVLETLAKENITSVLIEGGQEVLSSFSAIDQIDQMYIYTAPTKLKHGKLKNPLRLTEEWAILEEELLGEDKLIMAEKGVECLQEL